MTRFFGTHRRRRLPLPTAEDLGLEDSPSQDWFMHHLRPYPTGVYETLSWLAKPAGTGLPVTSIAYTDPALPTIELSRERARGMPGWTYQVLAAIHDAAVQQPGEIAKLFTGLS